MQSSLISKAFENLVESCPHGDSNAQCPFDVYRNLRKNGFEEISDICSFHNKELMLRYHKVCNRIRTSNTEKKILKAV